MHQYLKFFQSILPLLAAIASFSAYAFDSKRTEGEASKAIIELYHRVNAIPKTSIADRINWFSAQFKGLPYYLGSLGEGPTARYDQYPRYRTDTFDCDTFVNTVLALAQANSLTKFRKCIRLNRYEQGEVDYIRRNHFTSLDWNGNNQKRGVLKDITLDIKDEQERTVAEFAQAKINKSGWYAHKTLSTIRLQNKDEAEAQKRLTELKTAGQKLGAFPAKIPYLPLTRLFEDNRPNLYLFSQIPHGAIIEIVRPNWDLRKEIGTALNVSHLGFAVWVGSTLYFRQASSQLMKVVDVPLIDYLKEALKSPTIKGINVQVALPTSQQGQCD
jgi:hypothetical protein